MEQDVWNGYLLQAAQCLSRACERLAEEVGSGETGVKDNSCFIRALYPA